MEFLKSMPRPSTRLNRGNVLLANAQMVDTQPVQARLDAFSDIHRRYIEAHQQVAEAQALEREGVKRVEAPPFGAARSAPAWSVYADRWWRLRYSC